MHPMEMDTLETTMDLTSDVEMANAFVARIEAIEAGRRSVSQRRAREDLAARLKTNPGTLENMRRLRLKSIPHWLMTRIRAEFINVLQSEVARLEHEIAISRQIGTDHRDDDLAKAEAQISAAKAILRASS